MKQPLVAPIWNRMPRDLESRLRRCLDGAVNRSGEPVCVFFRADDIGVPGASFRQMMQIFAARRAPLNLALVPAWLTRPRWQVLQPTGRTRGNQWCWHQHGWRHANHESVGKKQEFGPSRSLQGLAQDLKRGRQRLEEITGREFYPVFTPPWNRCDSRTLDLVTRHGYLGVSRSRGSRPAVPANVADIPVSVDLHTRRETDPAAGWTALLAELSAALAGRCCGIMIHHQRMNPAATGFLDLFLKILTGCKDLRLVHFRELIDERLIIS